MGNMVGCIPVWFFILVLVVELANAVDRIMHQLIAQNQNKFSAKNAVCEIYAGYNPFPYEMFTRNKEGIIILGLVLFTNFAEVILVVTNE